MSDGIGSISSPLVAVNVRGAQGGERMATGLGQIAKEGSSAVSASSGSSASRVAEQAIAERTKPAEPVEASDMDRVVESINAYLQSTKRALEFSVDDVSGRTVITVMDADRENVIRQIPPEQMLALAEQLRDEQVLEGTGLVDRA
ncbi:MULTISPECIES: flagellar protein FlaG [unclassified Thioalkalivibrio]|uniref:flagellar protein FlaG n=1 Tax=unclassified Thioalkalivibrio TaxID=2621013 RepID=UPI001E5B015C|nr:MULTISPECIES: flagellar protein FlaG [unclassified Thioalkalivibrio]